MANDTTVIQRADKFGVGTTYNPYKNSLSTTNLQKQRFRIADTPTYADSPVIIVSTGLVPNWQDFIGGNIVCNIYDTDETTLLETLLPKVVDVGSGLFPAKNEINWFDVVGMQGDFYVNEVWAGKILEISGNFETCSITAEDINTLFETCSVMAKDINTLMKRQPKIEILTLTGIEIMNSSGDTGWISNNNYHFYPSNRINIGDLFRAKFPDKKNLQIIFWNLKETIFTATATTTAYAPATATATAPPTAYAPATAPATATATATYAATTAPATATATAYAKAPGLTAASGDILTVSGDFNNLRSRGLKYRLTYFYRIVANFYITCLSM